MRLRNRFGTGARLGFDAIGTVGFLADSQCMSRSYPLYPRSLKIESQGARPRPRPREDPYVGLEAEGNILDPFCD
jgi:hypothetical protein